MWNLKALCTEPMRVLSCGRFVTDEPFRHSARQLSSHVLLLGLVGELHITQGACAHVMRPGDALLLRAGEKHFGHALCAPPLSYYWCHFVDPDSAVFVSEGAAEDEIATILAAPKHGDAAAQLLIPEMAHYPNADRLTILFQQLLHHINANPYTHCIADYSLTLLLLEMTQQRLDAHILQRLPGGDSRIHLVLEWTRINCHRVAGVRDVASRFHYNPDYLTTLCRQLSGMGMQQYIHSCKIARAKQMLTNTSEPVYVIAHSLGFADDKYFMRLFKQYEKITPTAFRNAFDSTHLNQV